MKIVLASSNPHKVKEINEIVANTGLEFILPPEGFDPVENGETFEENSKIKALAAWKLTRSWTLADDSGLCIKALGGKPGIYSARYAETPEKRIERVLSEMEEYEKNKYNHYMSGLTLTPSLSPGDGENSRGAEFVCAMTLINPEGEVEFACKGVCKGSITRKPSGTNGFGYDPIFQPEGYEVTIAQLSEAEKNRISHRSVALREVIKYITSRFQ